MIKIIKTLVLILVGIVYAQAQTPSIAIAGQANEAGVQYPIFSFGDEMVYNDEFMRVFNKNKRDKVAPTQAEIEEYLDLYIKFKLKVAEAYDRKMDTVPSFKAELAGYRVQLAQPYLTDKSVTDMLVKEAYDRSQQEVNASHLLVNCSLDAKPSDSLAAYQKIMGFRSRIEKGEKFEDLAASFSDDPSAKTNKGNLGYFTAFQMIYPFENAAFSTEIGAVSMPVRTQFGYHLVYTHDKRESFGDVKVAHIMIKYYNPGQIDSTKERIDAVHAKLKDGADWNTTVEEFSEDFNTNSKGGELSWFNRTTNNIPNEFKDVAYDLKNDGDFTQPIKTKFGWHIIRRVTRKEKPSYDEVKDGLRRKVERDSRSELNKDVVVARVKIENEFKEVAGISSVKNEFSEDLLKGKFKKKSGNGSVLFTIEKRNYTDSDFYAYVATNQTRTNKSLENVVIDMYSNFVKQSNLDYEQSILEVKYEDFKYIMQEYKDGILLFELTDKEVWSKAVADSAGLVDFYAKNTGDYMWEERANASIYSCKDAKSAKQAMKLAKKGVSSSDILAKCNAKDPLTITLDSKKFEKGNNSLLDQIAWSTGVYGLPEENGRSKFVQISEILPASAKPLKENMGQATSDYQNYLESQWISELKKKYPIQVYEQNVKQLYN
ncbi:MAG: peptidylprolyl isomerase [Bacteroidetes bacterium]|nr:MAG: peptidylprolyl isomerase [Bacteroidota bacterium]